MIVRVESKFEVWRVKNVLKPAAGKRQCNCRNEVYHKKIGPGMFQQMTEQVCEQCPNVKFEREGDFITVDIEKGVQDGHVQILQGHETEGSQANNGSQSRGGNQSVPWKSMNGHFNFMPVPLGDMVAVPSLHTPILDSLNTLTEYMNRMGLALSQNADQHNQSPAATNDLPTIELPTNARAVPTVEAMSIVLRHAHLLLNDHAVAALAVCTLMRLYSPIS